MGQYPYQLFYGKPTYPFTQVKDVSTLDNAQILKSWTDEIIQAGHDILVRDVSYLGFPSYHIIIPGLSELLYPDDIKYRATNTRYYISSILRDAPETINKDNCKLFIGTMDYFLGNAYENTMESYYGVVNPVEIPCESIHCGCAYMIAMCHVMIEEYDQALRKMGLVLKLAERGLASHTLDKSEYVFYLAVRYYIDAMNGLRNHSVAMDYMQVLFDTSVCEKIDLVFADRSNIISMQYPGTLKYGVDNRKRYAEHYEKISHYSYALRNRQTSHHIDQTELRKVIQYI